MKIAMMMRLHRWMDEQCIDEFIALDPRQWDVSGIARRLAPRRLHTSRWSRSSLIGIRERGPMRHQHIEFPDLLA